MFKLLLGGCLCLLVGGVALWYARRNLDTFSAPNGVIAAVSVVAIVGLTVGSACVAYAVTSRVWHAQLAPFLVAAVAASGAGALSLYFLDMLDKHNKT